MVSIATTQLCHHGATEAISNKYTKDSGCVSTKVDLWALKLEFSLIFMLGAFFLLISYFHFFQYLKKKCKDHALLTGNKKPDGSQTGAVG